MTPLSSEVRDELLSLLADYCDGTMKPAAGLRLESILKSSAAARTLYVEYLDLHLTLRSKAHVKEAQAASPVELPLQEDLPPTAVAATDATAMPTTPVAKMPPAAPTTPVTWLRFPTIRVPSIRSFWNPRAISFYAMAAIAYTAYVVFLSWGIWDERQHARGLTQQAGGEQAGGGRREAGGAQVATITDSENARWVLDKSEVRRLNAEGGIQRSEITNQKSEIHSEESLSLASGIVELQLKQGVTLFVQGPAQWSIDGDNRATLTRGKLRAQVPPRAVGFLLETPSTRILDLGTEFTAEANAAGETEVQVIRGEVELVDAGKRLATERITAGQARRVRIDGAAGRPLVERIAYNPREASFAEPVVKAEKPLDRWRRASKALLADPSLAAYYDFEMPSPPPDAADANATLFNAREDRLHGQVLAPTGRISWADGRWWGKRALALGTQFAYVNIPDDPALQLKERGTIAIWFLPITKHWRKHSRIVAKGDLSQSSYSLWLAPDCRIRFLADAVQGKRCVCDSREPVALNRWHLAVVTMSPEEVRLYIDGELSQVSKRSSPFVTNDAPLLVGRPDGASGWPVFVGVVDELSLFSRALGAEDVAEMYHTGATD